MLKPTLQHCRDYNLTWLQHCMRSAKWAFEMQIVAFCLFVHALFPWVFENYSSAKIFSITDEMKEMKSQKATK